MDWIPAPGIRPVTAGGLSNLAGVDAGCPAVITDSTQGGWPTDVEVAYMPSRMLTGQDGAQITRKIDILY